MKVGTSRVAQLTTQLQDSFELSWAVGQVPTYSHAVAVALPLADAHLTKRLVAQASVTQQRRIAGWGRARANFLCKSCVLCNAYEGVIGKACFQANKNPKP